MMQYFEGSKTEVLSILDCYYFSADVWKWEWLDFFILRIFVEKLSRTQWISPLVPSLSIFVPWTFCKTGSSAFAKASPLKWDILRGNAFLSFFKNTSGEVKSISPFTHSTVREMCWLTWLVNFRRIIGHAYLGLILLSFRNVPFCGGRKISASISDIVEGPP